ncbi:MAG TPA: VOC family protein [Vicinamibacterales bacterium]|jgi:hypothetical protein
MDGRLIGALCMTGVSMAWTPGSPQSKGSPSVLGRVDHLVYATPNLQAGVERIEELLGVRATPGGQHPGVGTRNALVSLGPATYLEIIGPDPDQPNPSQPRTFGIDTLPAPRLATWAAKAGSLEQIARDAEANRIPLGPISSGSRKTPDGVVLSWRYTSPRAFVADGVVPFFIDWGTTTHPATTAVAGGTVVDLRAEHPDPESVQKMLRSLGLDLAVSKGATPSLVATIQTPRGRVELR